VARFLFVVPPLTGHINPTISVARALAERGHAVAWTGFAEPAASLLPPDAQLIPMPRAMPQEVVDAVFAKFDGLRGASALHALWEDFLVPLARAMVPGVEAALEHFRADVIVADQQALAGALVAQRRGLRWATSATTSGEFADPFAGLPRVREWVEGHLRDLQQELGVPPERRGDPRFSEHLVLLYSSQAFVAPDRTFPPHYALVGPCTHARPQTTPFAWDALRPGPRVFVSLGTVNAQRGARFFAAVVEAFAAGDVQIVLVAPPSLVGPAPEHVLVCERVPQLALLEHVDAVVCHGGHNTVCEALARGLPLVVAPIRDDQPIVADQVVRAGAGLRLHFGRARPGDLRAAVDRILGEPSFRAAARRIGASFAAAGGALRSAELLEALA
jgi:MGT family glycosyltransferase